MPGAPNFGGVTAQFGKDPLGFLRNEVDYWGSKVGEPFGASFDRSGMNTQQQQPYQPTGQDYRQGFEMTNPEMSDAYSQSASPWIQRLKNRLKQGGMPMRDPHAQSQQPMPQQQQQPMGEENPMEARSRALNASYNQGRNIGQAAQGIGRMFGGG